MAKPTISTSTTPIRQAYTLTYSESSKGFPSFYSYQPEEIVGINQDLFTFDGGNLYIHNSDNVNRCTFYGSFTGMQVRSVLNTSPADVKVFKTIALDSTHAWGYDSLTDLESGDIDSDYFEQKEGDWFAYIRGIDSVPVTESELPLRSSQGIASATSVDISDPANVIISYPYKAVDNIISVGDLLYFLSGGVYTLCGVITSTTTRKTVGLTVTSELTVDTTTGIGGSTAILAGDYTFYIKNAISESHGLRGYYLEFLIENYETDQSELFMIESDIFKSFP